MRRWPTIQAVTERPMTETPTHRLRTAALSHRKATHFRLQPDEATRAALAASLDLQALPKLSFTGEITPAGRQDFVLQGRLYAEAVQSCVVTLAPVAREGRRAGAPQLCAGLRPARR